MLEKSWVFIKIIYVEGMKRVSYFYYPIKKKCLVDFNWIYEDVSTSLSVEKEHVEFVLKQT